MFLIRLAQVLFVISWIAAPAFACSCAMTQFDPAYALPGGAGGAVFVGTVKEVTEEPVRINGYVTDVKFRRARFAVQEYWSGVTSREIFVDTALGGSECGVHFVAGRTYLVFAGLGGGYDEGTLNTNLCTYTGDVEFRQDELKQLRKFRKPRKFRRGKRS